MGLRLSDDTPANGQAVMGDPIVIHAKPFQLILQSELVNRQAVYCGPNSDVYSSTNVRIFIPESFDNLFGKLCTVDPIVMFIQAPMFGYLYQNPLTIYLA